eukprot:gnl/TRDRNA2_/TRDRNA2_176844_c1_seq8.p1 gnl/TRDRNA2_/TRDRNA2_176844_c1~~gnl/TRDRNA2_/TRDRNA2_176844_c1_seq8.p1  ORF type:complete len:470 (+),score=83.85 gnl/TRDRNA2_/TRDRNA2_176844_c1_seq8:60-1469(+)
MCAQDWQQRLAEKLHADQMVMLEAFSCQLREHQKRLLSEMMLELQKYEACIEKSAQSEVNACDVRTSCGPRVKPIQVKSAQNDQPLSMEDRDNPMPYETARPLGLLLSEKSSQEEVAAEDLQTTIVSSDQKLSIEDTMESDNIQPASKVQYSTMQSGFLTKDGRVEQDEPAEQSAFRKSQKKAEALYLHVYVQVFVAGLIAANFLTNMIEKQIDPKGVLYEKEFRYFELGYNVAFTIELILNMYAFWWSRFWRSSWNIFDFVVVSIGIFMSLNLPLPPSLSLLRMMRAFRVFRLFKRVQSLNKIIVALLRAVPGVMNAFLIQAITMCIFSILAVEFYQNIGKVCDADGICGPCSNEYITSRGDCIGDEYFGSFLKSLYTFFQVLTGDSWSEAVARPIMWWMDQPVLAFFTAMFFSCYILVAAVVLINVVVAVLLDKMGEPLEDEETPGDEGKQDDETLGTSTRKPKQTS